MRNNLLVAITTCLLAGCGEKKVVDFDNTPSAQVFDRVREALGKQSTPDRLDVVVSQFYARMVSAERYTSDLSDEAVSIHGSYTVAPDGTITPDGFDGHVTLSGPRGTECHVSNAFIRDDN